MGRPLKKGLDYFNVDCKQEDNLTYIEAKHGLTGYGIVLKLWRKIYMMEGYFTYWDEVNIYLFGRDINIDIPTINEVVESCFSQKIFNRVLYEKFKILTSSGIQKRYIKIVTEAKRKDVEIIKEYSLLGLTPEETSKTPEETSKTPEESAQKKVKESKVKDNSLPVIRPVPKKVDIPKKQDETEPFWKELVEVWFNFGKKNFGVKPSFERDDPRIFKRIIGRLKNRAKDQEAVWDISSSQKRLLLFLERSFTDTWLSKNFLLSNLEKQADKIFQNQGVKNSGMPRDIDFLFERFLEGQLDMKLLVPEHFKELHTKGLLQINNETIKKRMKGLYGSRIMSETDLYNDYEAGVNSKRVSDDWPFLMRIAILEYFKEKKEKLSK